MKIKNINEIYIILDYLEMANLHEESLDITSYDKDKLILEKKTKR